MSKLLWEGNEWSFEKLEKTWDAIQKIAVEKYELDLYPNQIEIISAEQMLHAYATIGLPIFYEHWSHGKQFVSQKRAYKRGQMGLAYELIINSNPCISYLMEENTMTMQTLVLAHAAVGHNSFFKNNYLFKQWTDADSIVDYLLFARNYLRKCEERYGEEQVEEILDSCHALMNYGVDRYQKPKKLSILEEKERQNEREEYQQSLVNDIWKSLPPATLKKEESEKITFPSHPYENLLHFVEENSPILKTWQREIIRIVRNISQYFYPQRQTQVINEGFATFWHYTLLHDLYDLDLISEGSMLEFLQSHTNVISQPAWDSKHFSGINPYALGFNMFRDIRRICQNPTEEDYKWFSNIAGSNWIETNKEIMSNFKDESFISQFLSPKVIRDLRLFSITNNKNNPYNYVVTNIHDDDGYRLVRQNLSDQYNLSVIDPNIQIYKVDKYGDRTMYLHHHRYNDAGLNKNTEEVLRHLHRLWGFRVVLESIDKDYKVIETYTCENK